jgi:hypothetical protein
VRLNPKEVSPRDSRGPRRHLSRTRRTS